jgi:hypothetical protein
MRAKLFFAFLMLLAASGLANEKPETHKWTCEELQKHGSTPKFSIQRRESAGADTTVLYLQMTVDPKAFLSERDVTLIGCSLDRDYPEARQIHALLFDNVEAARNLALYATDQTNYGEYLWHLRGKCEIDRIKSDQYVDFLFPEAKDGMMVPLVIRVEFSSGSK